MLLTSMAVVKLAGHFFGFEKALRVISELYLELEVDGLPTTGYNMLH